MANERDLFANFERMRREMDELWARRQAEEAFGGEVTRARAGSVFEL